MIHPQLVMCIYIQQWIQDFSCAGNVTDDEGQRAFALVNKATGQALVNKSIYQSDGIVHVRQLAATMGFSSLYGQSKLTVLIKKMACPWLQVQLAPYFGDVRVDLSMLWTLSAKDLGGGFLEVRVLRDITQTLNALWGNVKEGTVLGIDPSSPGQSNAVWKFTPVHSAVPE